MKITSVFENNDKIPEKYTCKGLNVNPPLTFSKVPAEAKSLALIVDDPDAVSGTFVHWLIFNMPPSTIQILENSIPENSTLGMTDGGMPTYTGPCPPTGVHRYFFKLYALDQELDLSQAATKEDLEEKMNDHIIEKAELVGLFGK